jgi:dimethylglycine dehydrogenase
MQASHMRWFEQHLPEDGGVKIRNVSTRRLGFQIAGPNAKQLLAKVAFQSVEDFKFLDVKHIDIGTIRALVQRVSYTGDLGFEIYCDANEQTTLYNILANAGKAFGMKPFGMRAMMSLRLEKGFGSWAREFRPDYMPGEVGMDRFISWKKNTDFIGRTAAEKERSEGSARKLVSMIVDSDPGNLDQGDVWGYEPIFHDNKVIGFVTSGGFAHYSQKSVAFGLVPAPMAKEGQKFEIEILGERRNAVVYIEDLIDPDGAKMRA